jgi:hypothetical protein
MADNVPQRPEEIQPGNPSVPPAPLPDQIILKPQPRPPVAPAPTHRPPPKKPGPGDMKDGTREVIETIVFVVVLVLLLKTFLAEAFVIPTGSMATTLLGYHREVSCEKCSYRFLANASSEAEEERERRQDVTKCYCPNCRELNVLRRPLPDGVLP